MKTVICLILAVLTWGERVESYWNLMKAGRYDEARIAVEKYINEGRKVSDTERAEAEPLLQKAQLCQEMKETAKAINIVDSMKVTKNNMISVCEMVMGGGRVKTRADGGAEFVATRGNKRLISIKGSTGFDIYRQYGDDEIEKLSDVVNTESNEIYPFEMSDGVTLYFASNGNQSIGGYDLFMARYNSETFDYSNPQNIGMPFNTLGNEYIMMADDITGHGLWATDWRQTGDTVIIYVFDLEGETPTAAKIKEDVAYTETEKMSFIVNDTIVYTCIEQFRNPEARGEYINMKDLEKDIRITEMLLEDKRITVTNLESEEEKKALSKDIIDDEKYLFEARRRLKEMIKEIRKLEIKKYE